MNKNDIVSAVYDAACADGQVVSKAQVNWYVDVTLNAIKQFSTDKDGLSIAKFGTFLTRDVVERTARNPITGETVVVPAKTKIVFKPAAAFKELVQK